MKSDMIALCSIALLSRPPRGGRGLKYEMTGRPKPPGRRPPRGGRGLKFPWPCCWAYPVSVAPLAGGVD